MISLPIEAKRLKKEHGTPADVVTLPVVVGSFMYILAILAQARPILN